MDRGKQPNGAYSYLLMIAHICCDMDQFVVPALLPFLVDQRGFDYASAAGLVFAASFSSSLIQPLLGMVADKRQMPWMMGLGVLLSGAGIAAIGFVSSYWAVFVMVIIAGIGAAVFHPEGARMANCVAGENIGRAMSIFATGGNLGLVLGPLIAVFAVTTWGFKGTAIVLVPTVIIVPVLFGLQKKFLSLSAVSRRGGDTAKAAGGKRDDWPAFLRLCAPIFARSIVQNGINTFLPLYWVGVLLQTQQRGSLMLTVIAVLSAVAAFTGGRLADRFGFRRVIRAAFVMISPLMVLMLLTRNVWLATVVVIPLALALHLPHSPSIVLGQKYLPNRLGLASGVTLGLTVSMGGLFSPLLGKVGDNFGLATVMYVTAGVALIGFVGTLFLKEPAVSVNNDRDPD